MTDFLLALLILSALINWYMAILICQVRREFIATIKQFESKLLELRQVLKDPRRNKGKLN